MVQAAHLAMTQTVSVVPAQKSWMMQHRPVHVQVCRMQNMWYFGMGNLSVRSNPY